MFEKIKSSLESIPFVNRLYINKRAEIGDLVIEVSSNISMQDTLIIKNILLLLNQAGKLENLQRPINIAGWVYIHKKDISKDSIDALDAMRYAIGVDTTTSWPKKEVKDINNKKIDIEDVHIALDNDSTDDLLAELMSFTNNNIKVEKKPERLPGGVPVEFLKDWHIEDNQVLADKYKKGQATIRRWKKVLRQGGYDNESSK